MNRREVLQSLSVAGVGTLSGCSAVTGFLSSPPQLLAFGVINWKDEPQTVRVKMQDGETTVFEDRSELEPKVRGYDDTYYRHRSSEWGTIAEYTYSIRLNDGPWKQLEPSSGDIDSETECAILNVEVGMFGPDWLDSTFIPRPCEYELTDSTN
ncbi:hypothetical protein [Haloarchaeobius sp. DFWS5]|uniref:hypothetical protein n=1 Tax=Haloarchaeobius sp. DFWS5 TaxID=3446114 RepID=UPI003EBE1FC1